MGDTDETATNGRNELGRFEPGNQCSKGRQNHSAELKRAFTEAVTIADVESIVRTLVRMAGDGDVAAAKLVLDRACGKVDSSPVIAIQNNVNQPTPEDRRDVTRGILMRMQETRAASGEVG